MQNIYNSIVRITANNREIDYLNPNNIIIEGPSIGTGFFITSKYIITCAHVIDTAQTISFTIPTISNEKYEAIIKGICPSLDLAILEAVNFKSKYKINMPKSENINIQDKISVIGFPLGRNNIKVTQGIISGLQDGFIQIDSAINSGNSGGPLLKQIDNYIYVIGIISSKVVNADGVGFAIPIQYLKIFTGQKPTNKIYNSCNFLAKFSNTSNSRLEMINNLLNPNSNQIKSGYTLSKVSKKSPLVLNGMEEGDLITHFDSKIITNFGEIKIDQTQNLNQNLNQDLNQNLNQDLNQDQINNPLNNLNMQYKINLVDYVDSLIPGVEYNLSFYSFKTNSIQNKKIVFSIEDMLGIKKIIPFIDKFESINIGGLIITPLTFNLIEKKTKILFKIRKYASYTERFYPKIIVTNILPTSPFRFNENINSGDIITKVNNISVNTIDELKKIIFELKPNEYVTIETESNIIDTISYNQIKNDIKKLKQIVK